MIYQLTSALPKYSLCQKTVFLRSDLNVPINTQGDIVSFFKLEASLPTINFILKNEGNIILATHLGSYEKAIYYSTKIFIPWFEKQGINISFIANLNNLEMIKKSFGRVFLLENLRHFAEEKNQTIAFAQLLKNNADYYVNDAFAAAHRRDTSLIILPELFSAQTRTIGFLVEKELIHLNKLLLKPEKPFIAILGGGKIATKIPLIEHLLKKTDTILLCPALVFTFLKAINHEIGKSLYDPASIGMAKKMNYAEQKTNGLIFPRDYQIEMPNQELRYCHANTFPPQAKGIGLGNESLTLFKQYIHRAKTIFFNGPMGFFDREETLQSSKEIFMAIAQSNGFSVVGGGDSIALLQRYGIMKDIDFVSTGGGATLSYLSGLPLWALQVFIN